MKIQLRMNAFGLYQTTDGRFGIRQINENLWVIQHRNNPNDPWDWELLYHETSFTKAVAHLAKLLNHDIDFNTSQE